MTSVAGFNTSSSTPGSAASGPSHTNERERKVVDWLIHRVSDRLADRGGQEHPPPWEPKRNVLLGVLEPVRVPVTPPTDAAEADNTADGPDDDAKPDPAMPRELIRKPSGEVPTLGMTFRIRAEPGATFVSLRIDAAFAMYLERIADLSYQRISLGEVPAAEPSSDTGTGALAATSTPAAASPTGPSSGTSQDDTSAATACGASAKAANAANAAKKRAKKVRILGSWNRSNVAAHGLYAQLPLNGDVVTIDSDLQQRAGELIWAHYERTDAMRPLLSGRNQIPEDALASEDAFAAELDVQLDRSWQPVLPDIVLQVFAQPLGGDEYLASVTLRNETKLKERPVQDLSVYDCNLTVHSGPSATLVTQRFDLAPDDYRLADAADVVGRGVGCVVETTADGGLQTQTLPRYTQQVIAPREDHVMKPRWSTLASDPGPILDSVEEAMNGYAAEFAAFADGTVGQPHHATAERERAQFADELRRFALGRQAMSADPRLAEAFKLANEAFAQANAGKPFETWRLFQLIYIVSHLPALAARELEDEQMRAELDYVDVLWFPAGGGKTEAYLGLIVTALFYDRLRGKDRGVTSWLRFPLRMLSVQQLTRVLKVLVVAEELRVRRHVGAKEADPFALGYLVGSSNTPNTLKWDKEWWGGWEAEARRHARGEFSEHHASDRLITTCPWCSTKAIVLDLDIAAVAVIHRCTACQRVLPVWITDEEVYRHLPAVIISTVDKLTGYTWFGEYTSFNHGPRFCCPQHGYYSFPLGGTCLVGPDLHPPSKGRHPPAKPTKDPVPSITVQDEMHLLREELGAFGGHYEGLIAELQRGGPSALPTKVLAASATVEAYEDQLRQVYGRRPRAFPSPGFTADRSFYVHTRPDVRRTFVGVLPNYRRKADVAAIVSAELLEASTHLPDSVDPLADLGLGAEFANGVEARDLLFDYEVALSYVNSKSHGSKIDEELGQLSDNLENGGFDRLRRVVLTGQVPIPDLSDAIERVQTDRVSTPRSERLRSLVGTSVVSHGVDLDRLNMLIMAGMPTTAADYIQVTARSGRTHAGLVVTVYDPFSRRERSMFTNFPSYHRFLDQMVTPVPVNKYAWFVANRTLPGMAMALFYDLARDPSFSAPPQGVRAARDFAPWWRTHRERLVSVVRDRLERCYATPVSGVNDPGMEAELAVRALGQWVEVEAKALDRPVEEKQTVRMFHEAPLTNFRDIDTPSDFAVGPRSREAYEALRGAAAPVAFAVVEEV